MSSNTINLITTLIEKFKNVCEQAGGKFIPDYESNIYECAFPTEKDIQINVDTIGNDLSVSFRVCDWETGECVEDQALFKDFKATVTFRGKDALSTLIKGPSTKNPSCSDVSFFIEKPRSKKVILDISEEEEEEEAYSLPAEIEFSFE